MGRACRPLDVRGRDLGHHADRRAAARRRVSSFYSLAGIAAGAVGLLRIRRADLLAALAAAILAGLAADLSGVWLHSYAVVAAGRFVTGSRPHP